MRFGLGFGTRNVLLNRNNAEAAYRQTPAEHDEALHQFERPGQTPAEQLIAAEEGMIAEKELPKYWDDDTPRRDLGGSSSWINEIEYLPSVGMAILHAGGRQYYYPMTTDEAGNWVTSDSIGQYYNQNVKMRG
jgi:hypothetical protein